MATERKDPPKRRKTPLDELLGTTTEFGTGVSSTHYSDTPTDWQQRLLAEESKNIARQQQIEDFYKTGAEALKSYKPVAKWGQKVLGNLPWLITGRATYGMGREIEKAARTPPTKELEGLSSWGRQEPSGTIPQPATTPFVGQQVKQTPLEQLQPQKPPVQLTEEELVKALPLIMKPASAGGRGTVDRMLEFYNESPDRLRRDLITVGRNISTEALVKKIYPDITTKGMEDYFSKKVPSGVEGVPSTGSPMMNWRDKFNEIKTHPEELLPFAGELAQSSRFALLYQTAKMIEEGKTPSREALQELIDFAEITYSEKDLGYQILDIVSQIPQFGLEIMATLGTGVAGAGAVGARSAALTAKQLLKSYINKAGLASLKKLLVAGTVQAGKIGVARVPAATIEKQLIATLSGNEENIALSVVKAMGENWVEVVSERTGGLFGKLTDTAKGALIKKGLFSALIKANPNISPNMMQRALNKMQWHGIAGEWSEERIGDLMHGALSAVGLGDQPLTMPTLEQTVAELVAFSVPGAAMGAVGSLGDVSGRSYTDKLEEMVKGIIEKKYTKLPEAEAMDKAMAEVAKTKKGAKNIFGAVAERAVEEEKAKPAKVAQDVPSKVAPKPVGRFTLEQVTKWKKMGVDEGDIATFTDMPDHVITLHVDPVRVRGLAEARPIAAMKWMESLRAELQKVDPVNTQVADIAIEFYKTGKIQDAILASEDALAYIHQATKIVKEEAAYTPRKEAKITQEGVDKVEKFLANYPESRTIPADKLVGTPGSPTGLARLPNKARDKLYNLLVPIVGSPQAHAMRDWKPTKITQFLGEELKATRKEAAPKEVTPEVTPKQLTREYLTAEQKPTPYSKNTDTTLEVDQAGVRKSVTAYNRKEGITRDDIVSYKTDGGVIEIMNADTISEYSQEAIDKLVKLSNDTGLPIVNKAGGKQKIFIDGLLAKSKAPQAEVTPPVTEAGIPKARVAQDVISEGSARELIKRHYDKSGKPDGWQGSSPRVFKTMQEAVEAEVDLQAGKAEPVAPKVAKAPKTVKPEATPEDVSTKVPKEAKPAAIAKFIQDVFTTVRQGRVQGGAAVRGTYNTATEIIRIKSWKDIGVLAHEVAHHIDVTHKFELNRWITKPEVDKLLVGYDLEAARRSAVGEKGEAFGEFLKYYVIDPIKVKKMAPKFYKKFFETMEQYPEILANLNKVQEAYALWKNLPDVASVAADMTFATDKYPIDYKKNIRHFFDTVYSNLVDDVYEIEKYAALGKEIAKVRGKEILSKEDISILIRLMKGDPGRAQTFLESGTFSMNRPTKVDENGKIVPRFTGKSLEKVFEKATTTGKLRELSIYMYAKHVTTSGKRIVSDVAELAKFRRTITKLEKTYPWVKETARDIQAYTNALLDFAIEGEVLDQAGKARMQAMHPFYVPLFRDTRLLNYMQTGTETSQTVVKAGVPFKVLGENVTLPVNDVLENLVKATYMVVNKANTNKITSYMDKLSKQGGELAKLFERIPTKSIKVGEVTGKQVGKKFGLEIPEEQLDEVLAVFAPETYALGNGIIRGYIKGKPVHFQIGSKELYEALKGLNRQQISTLVRWLGTPTRMLRLGAIYNPEFLFARNPIKDTIDAAIFSLSGFRPFIDTVKGVIGVVRKDADYIIAKQMGAMRSTLASVDTRAVQKNLEDITTGTLRIQVAKHPIEALRMAGDILEQASRLGEFKRVLGKTGDPWKAAASYREVTVDFLRMGAQFREVNALIAFANPAVQGTDRFFRAFKNRPLETFVLALAIITLPTLGLYLRNRDDARWKEIPVWRKNTSWIILPTFMPQETWDEMSMQERADYNATHPIGAIPKPFLFGAIFADIPERAFEVLDGAEPKIFDDLNEYLVETATPSYIPTGLEALLENRANFDFFRNRRAISDSMLALTDEMQYSPHTTETAKLLGKWAKYPPWKIDNIIESFTAGLGGHATDILDTLLTKSGVVKKPAELPETWRNLPVVRALILRDPYGSSGQALTSYYDTYNEYKANENQLKRLQEEHKEKEFYSFLAKHPELIMKKDKDDKIYSETRRALDRINRQLAEIRTIQRWVWLNEELTPDEKKLHIDESNQGLTEIAWGALELLNEHPDEFVNISEVPVKWR